MPWPYAIVACSIGCHVFAGRSRPATSPGKPVFGGVPKPALGEHLPHRLRRQRQRDLRGADVRRLLDHLLDRQRAVRRARRGSCSGPIVSVPGAVWITVSGRTLPASSAAAIVNGFSVEPGSKTSVSARLRILSRATWLRAFGLYVGQLASARISPVCDVEDHEAAGLRLVRLDRRLQLAEREVLQARVDREREIAARLRRADRLDVLDGVAAPVDDDAAAAGLAAEPLLLRELDAFLADVVVAGEAEDVAHRLAGRVEAPVFVLVVQALDLAAPATRSATSGGTCFARKTKSLVGVEPASRAPAASSRAPARAARAAPASRRTCAGNAQSDLTGVEIASASPERSTMRPRCAGTSISRL